jgi:hypothetical protein
MSWKPGMNGRAIDDASGVKTIPENCAKHS